MADADAQTHTLLVLGRNRAALIARIAVLLAHRGIDIASLRSPASASDDKDIPIYLTMRVPAGRDLTPEITRLHRLVDVVRIVPMAGRDAHELVVPRETSTAHPGDWRPTEWFAGTRESIRPAVSVAATEH